MKTWALRIVLFILLAAGTVAVLLFVSSHVLDTGPFAHHWRADRTRTLTTTGTMLAAWQREKVSDSLTAFLDRAAASGVSYTLLDEKLRPVVGVVHDNSVLNMAREAITKKEFVSDKVLEFPHPGETRTEAVSFTGLDGKTYALAASITPRGMPKKPPIMWRIMIDGTALLVALVLIILLVRTTERPARVMRKALRQLSRGHDDVRIELPNPRSGDSLSLLAGEFNTLAENLARKRAEQDMLMGSISHEMRSPLSRMALALQLARGPGESDGTVPPEAHRLLDRINRDTERLGVLADQITSFTRVGRSTGKREDVNMASLVSDVVEACGFEAQAQGKCVTLSAESRAQLSSRTVRADEEQLVSMLENVIRNAVRHSPDSGCVTVAAHLEGRTDKPSLILSVRDHGPGVDEANLHRIFQPFVRGAGGGSSGLGLAIAHHVAANHGGRIHAANHTDGGFEVTIQLPLPSASRHKLSFRPTVAAQA